MTQVPTYVIKAWPTGRTEFGYYSWVSSVGPYTGHGHTQYEAVADALRRLAGYVLCGDRPVLVEIDWSEKP